MRRILFTSLGAMVIILGVSCGGMTGDRVEQIGEGGNEGEVIAQTPATAEMIASSQALLSAFADGGSAQPMAALGLITQVDNVLRLADLPVHDPTQAPFSPVRQMDDCIVSTGPGDFVFNDCQFGPIFIDGFIDGGESPFSMELTAIREGPDGTYSTHVAAFVEVSQEIVSGHLCFDRVTPKVAIVAGVVMDAIPLCPDSGSIDASVVVEGENVNVSKGVTIEFGPTCGEAVVETGTADVGEIACPSVDPPAEEPVDEPVSNP